MNSALAVINAHPEKVDGIKISLLDKDKEIAIEPLHPMYAFERACINTLEQALDVCDTFNPSGDNALGVAVDVHHTAWTRSSKRKSNARASTACWLFMCATGSRPPLTC